MQRDSDIHFAEKIKKQIPPDELIGKPVVVTPIEEPVKVIPEPAIVIETPVEQPPSYGGGGGGGGGQFDTQSLSENNPWDSYGRQLGGDRSRNMEFQ